MYRKDRNTDPDRSVIPWIQHPVYGLLISKVTRFSAEVEIPGGGIHLAYIPNSSRLEELLVGGRQVVLEAHPDPHRKTQYDLKAVDLQKFYVSIDARVPNLVVREWLALSLLPGLSGYRIRKAEYTYGSSRIDFLLEGPDGLLLLETKSCTLAKDGLALFPDAPTRRGARHLKALVTFRQKEGGRAVVLWVVQRPDAQALRPYAEIDPVFAKTALWAQTQGVEFYAIRLRVTPTTLEFDQEIPVRLETWTGNEKP